MAIAVTDYIKKGSVILDLGCGISLDFIRAFIAGIGFKHYTGIDEKELSPYFTYKGQLEDGQEPIPESEFNKYFKIIKSDLFNWLKQANGKYDLIVLSNILHFYQWDQIQYVVSTCKGLLSDSGVIYVRVLLKKIGKDKDGVIPFDQEKIEKLQELLPMLESGSPTNHFTGIYKAAI